MNTIWLLKKKKVWKKVLENNQFGYKNPTGQYLLNLKNEQYGTTTVCLQEAISDQKEALFREEAKGTNQPYATTTTPQCEEDVLSVISVGFPPTVALLC